jgi:hypothetical protein
MHVVKLTHYLLLAAVIAFALATVTLLQLQFGRRASNWTIAYSALFIVVAVAALGMALAAAGADLP